MTCCSTIACKVTTVPGSYLWFVHLCIKRSLPTSNQVNNQSNSPPEMGALRSSLGTLVNEIYEMTREDQCRHVIPVFPMDGYPSNKHLSIKDPLIFI